MCFEKRSLEKWWLRARLSSTPFRAQFDRADNLIIDVSTQGKDETIACLSSCPVVFSFVAAVSSLADLKEKFTWVPMMVISVRPGPPFSLI